MAKTKSKTKPEEPKEETVVATAPPPAKGKNKKPAAKAEANGKAAKVDEPEEAKEPKIRGPRQPGTEELSGTQIRVLRALKGAPTGLTRNDLSEITGITKGWARILGSPTREGEEIKGMEGAGLVKSFKDEDRRGLVYSITKHGKEQLAKAEKELERMEREAAKEEKANARKQASDEDE